MIRYIKLLRNIGTFDSESSAASIDLKRLVLIHAENGRGKTTLAAVLRSLKTGDHLPIVERRRLGAQNPPHICFECEGSPSNVVFQNDAWNRLLQNLEIYDDVFVDENIYSGLDVDAQHRQNLHQLIIGEQGITLNRRLSCLVSRVNQHSTDLNKKERAIPPQELRGFSVADFCALDNQPDIDNTNCV